MTVILAIDAGTTNVRTIAFDENARAVASSQREFPSYFPAPGWVEHDANEIWDAVQTTLAEVTSSLQETPVAIGVTNQRETVLRWRRSDSQPLERAIVWQDRRTAARCAELEDSGLLSPVREYTGLVLDPYFSGSKLEWLFQNSESATVADVAVGTIDSWIVWKLTGGSVHATDASNASRTMLFDIGSLDWSDELCDLFGVPIEVLPEVRPSSGHFGVTAADSGCGGGIPITAVAGDQHAALFGQTAFEPGDAKITHGTGSFILMNVGPNLPDPVDGLLTTVAWLLDDVCYALEGAAFATGATVEWLRDGLQIIDSASELEALAARCSSTGGVFLVPAFAGLGSPHWDPHARGAIVGLTRGTGRAEIARATIEAMVYQTRDVVEAIVAGTGTALRSLRVDGGASVMDSMLQLQADQLGVTVQRPKLQDATALGAAYLAGLALRVWRSTDEIKRHWELDLEVTPQASKTAANFAYADRGEYRALVQGVLASKQAADLAYADWQRAVKRSKNWSST